MLQEDEVGLSVQVDLYLGLHHLGQLGEESRDALYVLFAILEHLN